MAELLTSAAWILADLAIGSLAVLGLGVVLTAAFGQDPPCSDLRADHSPTKAARACGAERGPCERGGRS